VTKQSGLGDQWYVSGFDLSGDTNSIQRISGGPKVLDMTGIDKSAFERKGGQLDGGMDWTSYWNVAAGQAHPVLAALPRTDIVVSYGRGVVLGAPGAAMVGKQIGYDGNRDTEGNYRLAVAALPNGYGMEWGIQATAGKRTDGTATVGAAVDQGSASPGAFGLQMYVQLFAFTGTSVTIKLQESSDNGADTYADVVGATTGALTAVGAVRVATAAIAVERYLKVVTTGTFSNAVFAVIANRNATAVSF